MIGLGKVGLIVTTLVVGLPREDAPPALVNRKAQPYVAVRRTVNFETFGKMAPPAFAEVTAWLKKNGLKPSGPPMYRYLTVDMPRSMTVEMGFPIAKPVKGSGKIVGGSLPAGRYVRLMHLGDYSGMVAANGAAQDWARSKGLKWSMTGNRWNGRVEFGHVDPGNTPDSSKWKTEILYLVK